MVKRWSNLERGAEGRDELGGQLLNEAHRVGEEHLLPPGEPHPPGGRVKGREQQVVCVHLGGRSAVKIKGQKSGRSEVKAEVKVVESQRREQKVVRVHLGDQLKANHRACLTASFRR